MTLISPTGAYQLNYCEFENVIFIAYFTAQRDETLNIEMKLALHSAYDWYFV